jgi:hypothetical protein
MPNWTQIVRKKLRVLGVCSPEFTEELAAHLEDRYEALRCEGLSAEVAFQHTIGQIEGRCRVWLVILFLQEELMSGFITKIALPGLLTSAATFVFYWALALDHIQPRVTRLLGSQLPLWWWCLLPICGALGALLSQRKGRSRLQRMAEALLPSAILGISVLMIFVVGFTMSGFVNHYQLVSARLESLGTVPPGFVLMPAAFSVLGVGIAEISTKKSRLA